MPILDPSLAVALSNNNNTLEYKSKAFIINLIKEASKNINRNLEMIESSIQTKSYFSIQHIYEYINEYFGSNLTNKDFNSTNIFDLLYSKIDTKYKIEQIKYESIGTYYLYGSDLHFFQPCIEYEFRS